MAGGHVVVSFMGRKLFLSQYKPSGIFNKFSLDEVPKEELLVKESPLIQRAILEQHSC